MTDCASKADATNTFFHDNPNSTSAGFHTKHYCTIVPDQHSSTWYTPNTRLGFGIWYRYQTQTNTFRTSRDAYTPKHHFETNRTTQTTAINSRADYHIFETCVRCRWPTSYFPGREIISLVGLCRYTQGEFGRLGPGGTRSGCGVRVLSEIDTF